MAAVSLKLHLVYKIVYTEQDMQQKALITVLKSKYQMQLPIFKIFGNCMENIK